MKILFVTRPTVFSGPGGDTIQLLNTKEYLEKNFEISILVEGLTVVCCYKVMIGS